MKRTLRLTLLFLAGCSATAPVRGPAPDATGAPPQTVYVVHRGWHTDLGFPAGELEPEFQTQMQNDFPGARYLVFGFGDRRYVLAHDKTIFQMLGAMFPGAGLVLATGLSATPQAAFGETEVATLDLFPAQAAAIREFVWRSFERRAGAALHPYARGPYAGSLFYAASLRYSGLYTCNTWTAEALAAAGLPIRARGVLFAGQVWDRVRALPEARP